MFGSLVTLFLATAFPGQFSAALTEPFSFDMSLTGYSVRSSTQPNHTHANGKSFHYGQF
jgi:hypothetical protein